MSGLEPHEAGKGDSYKGDITKHRMAQPLFSAWHGDASSATILSGERPPGPIALRSRYRHIIDAARSGVALPPVPVEMWNRAIVLETDGDDAIRIGNLALAGVTFRRIVEDRRFDAVAVTHARIGLGDVHRARNDVEHAVEQYEAALLSADGVGYRFGRLRALVPLGYLTLAHHSIVRADHVFTEALALAEALEDPVYVANAAQGLAECAERSGETARAIEGYRKAFDAFDQVNTTTGRAHAAHRLGTLHHRNGDLAFARDWLVGAAQDFAGDNDPVGMTNVLESLGDLLLDLKDQDAAETQYRAARSIAVGCGLAGAQAHALQNLARVSVSRQDWPAAVGLFSESVAAYREEGDLLGVCTALGKLAAARERLGLATDALRDRVEAVFAIEEYRAANRDAPAQQEYRLRFAEVYALALRAAVSVQAAATFAVVADGLAGRRLAGLAEAAIPAGITDNLMLLQHVLVTADQRWKARRRPAGSGGMELPPGLSRQERIVRMLGATGLLGGLRDPAEAAVDDLLAALYLPPIDEGTELLRMLPDGCHTLQLVLDPGDPTLLHRLWRREDGSVRLDSVVLSAGCTRLLTVLQESSDERDALRPWQLEPLSELLPGSLRERLLEDSSSRVLILPVGELWLVPWGAVPLRTETVLGQAVEYMVCPSLVLQRVLRRRGPVRPVDHPALLWRSPLIGALLAPTVDPDSSEDDTTWRLLSTAEEAKSCLGADVHTLIVVCHGRLLEGPGHYLELDAANWLLPSDLLVATPPARLYLLTCWGAGVPGQATTDPVSIATLALAKGSTEVLATVGQYGSTPIGDMFAKSILKPLDTADVTISQAVHHATKALMDQPGPWRLVAISDWAPLLPIGTFRT